MKEYLMNDPDLAKESQPLERGRYQEVRDRKLWDDIPDACEIGEYRQGEKQVPPVIKECLSIGEYYRWVKEGRP